MACKKFDLWNDSEFVTDKGAWKQTSDYNKCKIMALKKFYLWKWKFEVVKNKVIWMRFRDEWKQHAVCNKWKVMAFKKFFVEMEK